MTGYGWTTQEIENAIRETSALYRQHGQIGFSMSDHYVRSFKCRRGAWTVDFRVQVDGSAGRLKDGTYPAGTGYTEQTRTTLIKDPLPWTELGMPDGYRNGRRKRTTDYHRGTGSPCWHVWGHVLRRLLDRNPKGKIVARSTQYEGREDFMRVTARKPRWAHECYCEAYGLEDFRSD